MVPKVGTVIYPSMKEICCTNKNVVFKNSLAASFACLRQSTWNNMIIAINQALYFVAMCTL